MPLSRIVVSDASITEAKIAANAVTQSKIAANAAQFPQIADANVITSKIADGNVTTSKIADANVTTSKIASANITSPLLASNLSLSGKTVFGAAIQERSNIIASNIGPEIIDIDPLNNSILFYTSNSYENSSYTVNFINLEGVEVGNAVSFVVAVTNNTERQSNITAVQVNGSACAGHERSATSNNLFISGGSPVTAGSANVDLYSFNIQKVQTSSYTVFLSRTNFS